MEFTLFYKGAVFSPRAKKNGKLLSTVERVDPIRLEFHKQLKELWTLCPLGRHEKDWPKGKNSKLSSNGVRFLVNKDLDMYAKLDIQVLVYRKDRRFKDIDNKLKTICDALRMPTATLPPSDEKPFFCLLKDDESIYQIKVDTDFLLCEHTDFKLKLDESLWIINVKIKGNRIEFDKRKRKDGADYKDLIV